MFVNFIVNQQKELMDNTNRFLRAIKILSLVIIVSCSTLTHKTPVLEPYSPGDFELGMTIEDFKLRNTGLEIYRAVADTVIYTRWEIPGNDGGHQIGYIFFNGKLFEVKRLMK